MSSTLRTGGNASEKELFEERENVILNLEPIIQNDIVLTWFAFYKLNCNFMVHNLASLLHDVYTVA